jgi:hypothetical protein
MKSSELIEAIERFFLDLVAYLIPGFGLIVVCTALWVPISGIQTGINYAQEHSIVIYLLCFGAYVIGQILETIGNLITWPVIAVLTSFLQKCSFNVLQFRIKKRAAIEKEVITSVSVKQAISVIRSRTPGDYNPDSNDLHSWRSRAMSDLSPDQSHVVYRFMFISILNLGMASVFLVAFLSTLVAYVNFALRHWFAIPTIALATGHQLGLAVLSLVMLYFFVTRRAEFYSRAMRVPFSMAVAKEVPQKLPSDNIPSPKPQTVYLAGGMRTNWQDKVLQALPDFCFLDPRSHQLRDADAYTAWDLDAVRNSDWVLAYLEDSNPGGFSLALEMGYAKAISKKLILVDEKSASSEELRGRLAMLHSIADYCPHSLDEAISILRQMADRNKASATKER